MPARWGTRIAALCFIAISLYICVGAVEFPDGGGTFPLFAAGSAIVLCLVLLITSFPELTDRIRSILTQSRNTGAKWLAGMIRRKGGDQDQPITFDFSFGKMKPLFLTALSIVYVLAMFEIGYFTASILFLFIAVWMVGVRNIRSIIITAIILFPVMYGFFIMFLHANLPRGILF